MAKSFYDTLGVTKSSSDDEIKKAYRTLAKKYHPDLNQGDENASKKFKEINEAYDTLSDPQKRAEYDSPASSFGGFGDFGGFGRQGGGFGGSFFDDFVNIFNNSGASSAGATHTNTGSDIGLNITITFEEAAFGVTKEVNISRNEHCADCNGTGDKNGSPQVTCKTCNGSGMLRVAQDTPFGRIVQQRVCSTCGGSGKMTKDVCTSCSGRGVVKKSITLKIPVPAGIDNGEQLTVRGEGNKGKAGAAPGNLILQVNVLPHKQFKRKGLDLYIDLPITFIQAALGDKVFVPTLKNKLAFTLGEGTQTGTTFKLKGQGIVNAKGSAGDLFVTVEIETPKGLSKEQKDALKKMQDSFKPEQYTKIKELTRVKSSTAKQ